MESAVNASAESRTDPLRELALAAQGGDSSAVAVLWESVKRFIKWQARRRFRAVGSLGGLEIDDLVQEGFLALVQAVNDYDPERGSFLTLLNYNLLTAFAEALTLTLGSDELINVNGLVMQIDFCHIVHVVSQLGLDEVVGNHRVPHLTF